MSRASTVKSLLVLSVLARPCEAFIAHSPAAVSYSSRAVASPSTAYGVVSTRTTQQPSGVSEDDQIAPEGANHHAVASLGNSTQTSHFETPPIWIDIPPVSFEARWLSRYDQLVDYKNEHGNCLVPQSYQDNPALGRWVRSQRVEYSCLQRGLASHITQDRIDKLNSLGFVWDAKEATWNTYLEELRAFSRKYGTLHVPQSSEEHKKLALWVRNQRMHYAYIQRGKEEKSALTPERIRLLEDLGFIWDVNDVIWMEKFDMLKDLVEEFGHVPASCNGNQQLSRWCAQQRYQYKNLMQQNEEKGQGGTGSVEGKKSRKGGKICISQQRIDLLNSVGFSWNPSDAYWWKQYAALREYKKDSGHCDVPVSFPENPRLGHWVANQKRLCREYTNMVVFRRNMGKDPLPISGLNDDRLEALRHLDFDALPSVQKLETMVSEVESIQKPSPAAKRKERKQVPKKEIVPFPWDEI